MESERRAALSGEALVAGRPLFGRLLLDGQLTAVEAALGAYAVIQHGCTAVRAGNNRRNNGLVVSSSLITSRRRDFVFRMCHFTV